MSDRTHASIIPCLNYKDAPATIEWLCQAFGFEKHLIVPDEHGGVVHAELTFRNSMIMLGSSASQTEYGKLVTHPADTGLRETQSPYVIVEDAEIEEHYQRAKQAGAAILFELKKQDYGGSAYTCRDLEGHLWNFGSYDPWNS